MRSTGSWSPPTLDGGARQQEWHAEKGVTPVCQEVLIGIGRDSVPWIEQAISGFPTSRE